MNDFRPHGFAWPPDKGRLQRFRTRWVCVAAGKGPTLPLAIAAAELHVPPARGPIECVVETRSRTAERATFDAWLTAADGRAVARLSGIEMFIAPSGTAAD